MLSAGVKITVARISFSFIYVFGNQ